MARPLHELNNLKVQYQCPVVCCGDIFHLWDSSPQLINWACEHLPYGMLAIPGNHDLPYHNYTDLRKSAFWTLAEAGVIEPIPFGVLKLTGELILHGFPWTHPVTPCKHPPNTFGLHVAVVHRYIWSQGLRYKGAPDNQRLGAYRPLLEGYDAAFFGDNHKPFIAKSDGMCTVINCGTLMTRNADDLPLKPMVGLLHRDGRITPHFLDTSKDQYMDINQAVEYAETAVDLTAFMEQLAGLGEQTMDFADTLRKFLRNTKVGKRVKDIILKAMEERKNG
jgi:hypothetical protein